jgi:hypothetical protein
VRGNRATDVFSFVQDDLRVTNAFTLNLGLRVESSGGVSEVNGLLSNLDRNRFAPLGGGGVGALGTIDLGGTSFRRNTNWAPRFGFAWNPSRGKFVLRGGYAWTYDYIFLNPITNLRFSAPFIPSIDFKGPFTGSNTWANLIAGTAQVQSDARAAVGVFLPTRKNFGGLSPVSQTLKNPKATQWNLSVGYQLLQDLVLKASYVGTKGDFLQISLPINLLPPSAVPPPATSEADELARISAFQAVFVGQSGTATTFSNRIDGRFNDVTSVESAGSSIYHAFEFEVIKRFRQGYSFQAAYTFGHSIDNASDVLNVLVNDSPNFQDPRNLRENRGNSQFDVRQRFVLSYLWELPWGKRFSGPARRILDGWAFSGIFQGQSGFPTNIFSTNPLIGANRRGIDDGLLVGGSSVRANFSGGSFAPVPDGSPAAALIPSPCARGVNTSTTSTCTNTSGFPFTQPLLGNPGNYPRNSLRLDRFQEFDLAIVKNTTITERHSLQFRWELYNVVNTPSFAGFVNDLTSKRFGVYRSTGSNSRRMQIALKYIF